MREDENWAKSAVPRAAGVYSLHKFAGARLHHYNIIVVVKTYD